MQKILALLSVLLSFSLPTFANNEADSIHISEPISAWYGEGFDMIDMKTGEWFEGVQENLSDDYLTLSQREFRMLSTGSKKYILFIQYITETAYKGEMFTHKIRVSLIDPHDYVAVIDTSGVWLQMKVRVLFGEVVGVYDDILPACQRYLYPETVSEDDEFAWMHSSDDRKKQLVFLYSLSPDDAEVATISIYNVTSTSEKEIDTTYDDPKQLSAILHQTGRKISTAQLYDFLFSFINRFN